MGIADDAARLDAQVNQETAPKPEGQAPPPPPPKDPMEGNAEFERTLDPGDALGRGLYARMEEEDRSGEAAPTLAGGDGEPKKAPEPPKKDPAEFLKPEHRDRFAALPDEGKALVREVIAEGQRLVTAKTMELAEERRSIEALKPLVATEEDRKAVQFIASEEPLRDAIQKVSLAYLRAKQAGAQFDPAQAFAPPPEKPDLGSVKAILQMSSDKMGEMAMEEKAPASLLALSKLTSLPLEDLQSLAADSPASLRALAAQSLRYAEMEERVNRNMEPVQQVSEEVRQKQAVQATLDEFFRGVAEGVPEEGRREFMAAFQEDIFRALEENSARWTKEGHPPKSQLALARERVEAKRGAASARTDGRAAAEAERTRKRLEGLPASGGDTTPAPKDDLAHLYDGRSHFGEFRKVLS